MYLVGFVQYMVFKVMAILAKSNDIFWDKMPIVFPGVALGKGFETK